MIPRTSEFERELVMRRQPSRTYGLDVEGNRFVGMVDGLEAMRQAVYKVLMTERYEELIYSFGYGVELKGLVGMPMAWVCARLEGRICEALLQDDRVKRVEDFVYERGRGVLLVSFSVVTTEGNLRMEKEVRV